MENPNSPNMEQNPIDRQFAQQFGTQLPVPNASAVLVLGILSIVFALFFFCYLFPAVISLITGIIALALSPGALKRYNEAPQSYTLNSYNNLKAGRICAIIGVSLSGVILLFVLLAVIFYASVLGTLFGSMFNHY